MGYIGHTPTNAGTFYILDDITLGSGTTYTMQVGGVDVTPSADNLLITLDGVIQHAGDAYTVSGSNIVFASGPGSGVEFYGIIMGQSATVGQGSIGADELKVSGDGTNGQVLVSDGDGTFSWATDTEAYVPLAGGTMTGTLAMGSNNITGTGTIGGTLTTAAQTNITSLGTLTTLTVDDMTLNGSTISDAGAFDIDAGGVIKLDAGGGQIQFFDDGTEIGVFENSSSDFVMESKVQDKDILFKGNDGGSGIELMRMNMSGANVGISTGNSIGAKLHVADNRSTAYSSTGEPNETIIAHNKNGTDNSGVNNYASLAFAVADGATSQGFLNYIRTGNNTGDLTFSQRTGSSSYAEHFRVTSAGRLGVGLTDPASLLHVKTTANASETIRIQNDDSLTTIGVSSDGYTFHTYQHSLYWASWDGSSWSTKARLDNDGQWCFGGTTPNIGGWNSNYTVLTLKGKAANYGGTLELANLNSSGNYFGSISFVNLDGGSSVEAQARISAVPDGADDASAIVFETEPTGGTISEKLRIRGSTSNWCLDVTSPSPYGLQISTTASNSSSHDMFKVKRNDGTACIETWGDGNTKIHNEIQTKAGLRTYATNGANPSGDFYNVAHKFATYRQTLTASHITDGYVTFSNGIYRDNVLGVIANFFKVSGTGANNNYMGYQDSYITRADYYASNVARAYLGSSAEAGDYVYLTIIYHGNTG